MFYVMPLLVSINADLRLCMTSLLRSFVTGVSNGKAFVLFATQMEADHAMERLAGNSHGLTVEKARGGRMRTNINLVVTDTEQLPHHYYQNPFSPFGVRFGDSFSR